MTFEEEINSYEERDNGIYLIKIGDIPVLISSAHSMEQYKEKEIKKGEPLTKGISLYVAEHTNSSYLIKVKDTGLDANRFDEETYKNILLDIIKKNHIKLVLDIHGASLNRDFDIELGTLNNLSADYATVHELKEAFLENGIYNVNVNSPFKGGAITQVVYSDTDVDVIQIEINKRLRDFNNLKLTKLVCESLINFINQYTK